MSAIDYKLIRSQLPHGSIKRIADELDLSPDIVGHVLNKGWYGEYRASVLSCAMRIIREVRGSDELLNEAEELDLTSSYEPVQPRKRNKRSKTSNNNGPILIPVFVFFSLLAFLAWKVSPKFREFIQQNILAKFSKLDNA